MKIAVCFYGEMKFIDRFMIQNMMRCMIVPFQKYSRKEDVNFSYFLHTYFTPDVLSMIEIMRAFFPFTSMTLHDRDMVLLERYKDLDKSIFLQQYSLHRVKKKWKSMEDLDIVIYTRLDLLFTKALSESDIDLIFHNKRHLFLHQDNKPFLAIGDPMVMNVFADQVHELSGTDHTFLDIMRTQHSIKTQYVSLVFVRILPEPIVYPEDANVCPYLGDLIASSTTKIRLVKRKNSLNK